MKKSSEWVITQEEERGNYRPAVRALFIEAQSYKGQRNNLDLDIKLTSEAPRSLLLGDY